MAVSLWPEDDETLVPGDVFEEAELRALVEYQTRPIDFLVEVLHIPRNTLEWSLNPGYDSHRWDGTKEPIVSALEGLANWENVGVESATGTGKTYNLGAGGMLWFLGSFPNALVVTLAPKEDQLTANLWKEARKLFPHFKRRFPGARLIDLEIRLRGGLDNTWGATGFVAGVGADEESAQKARGFHAEHALYIFEETAGIHRAIHNAIQFTCTAPHNLQLKLGNPDNEQDELHKFCLRESTRHIRISGYDHPNIVSKDPSIVPGAVSQISIDEVNREYGKGSALANAMTRGIPPKESSLALIRWAWLEEAAARYSDLRYREGLPALGCDVADKPEGDKVAIARGFGAWLSEIEAFQVGERGIKDASELGAHLALEIGLEGIDERNVGVDAVGVGAATVNKLKELGILVQAINGGARPEDGIDEDVLREKGKGVVPVELFDNLNSQMLWQLRQDLQHGRLALPYDEELFRQLTFRQWRRHKGKIEVWSKEKVKEELGYSPDLADACVYWNWVRHRLPVPVAEERKSAFDPDTLSHEAKASRKLGRDKRVVPRNIDPSIIESLD